MKKAPHFCKSQVHNLGSVRQAYESWNDFEARYLEDEGFCETESYLEQSFQLLKTLAFYGATHMVVIE